MSADQQSGDNNSGPETAEINATRSRKHGRQLTKKDLALIDRCLAAALILAIPAGFWYERHRLSAYFLVGAIVSAAALGVFLEVRHRWLSRRLVAWRWSAFFVIVFIAFVLAAAGAYFEYPLFLFGRVMQARTQLVPSSRREPGSAFPEEPTAFPELTFGCLNIVPAGDLLAGIKSSNATPFLTFQNGANHFDAVSLYEAGGQLFASVDLESAKTGTGFIMQGNTFSVHAPDWDANSNDHAIEVVDENDVTVFQFVRRSRTHISIRGVFRAYGLASVAGARGEIGTSLEATAESTLLTPGFIPALFRHPGWKYPGVLADNREQENDCPMNMRGRLSLFSKGLVIQVPQAAQ